MQPVISVEFMQICPSQLALHRILGAWEQKSNMDSVLWLDANLIPRTQGCGVGGKMSYSGLSKISDSRLLSIP